MLCNNELPYLKNVVRQLHDIGDEIYICDDYSTDGSWEWLNDNKDKYKLNLYQRKCDYKPGAQRDFLLSKTPKECWVIKIDADEIPTFGLRYMVKDLLNNAPTPPDIDRVCIYIFNLVEDLNHYHEDIGIQSKIFWNSVKNAAHHIDIPHDTLQGSWGAQCGVIKYEQGFVHLKLLDKEKVKSGRTTWIEKGIYQKDHIGDVFADSKRFSKLPDHIGFDITSELIKHLELEHMLEPVSA
jgi:hypothetical protein